MKNIFRLTVAVALLALAPMAVQADVGTLDFAVTNKMQANATTSVNMGNAVYIGAQDACGIEVKIQGDAAGTGVQTLTFARSVDNTTFETTPRFTMTTALNGTTAVVCYTNIPNTVIGAAGWLKCVTYQNADAVANATNVTIRLIKKTIKAQ